MSNHAESAHHSTHHSHRPLYLKIFAGLIVLLVLTMVAAFFDLGEWNLIVAMTIAIAKAGLILMFFMHFRDSDTLTWIVGMATVVWFGIMIAMTMTDYLSRDLMKIPGK